MSTTFSIVPNSREGMDVFQFHGNMDAQAEALLKELPQKVCQPAVTFDFSRTGRINSMGIALLLRCLKSIREDKNAEIFLRELNQTNTMLFRMTGIFMLATQTK